MKKVCSPAIAALSIAGLGIAEPKPGLRFMRGNAPRPLAERNTMTEQLCRLDIRISPQDKTTKYEHILPALVAVEQDRSVEGLLILLNTVGGDVEAGLAIAELIAGMRTPTVSLVIGGGHSIGVPLAVSAKRSYIAPSASMTVHPVRVSGLLLGVPQSFDYLGRIQERICTFITQHSRIAPDHLRRLMSETGELATDVGSVLSGEQAVACGLIDRLGGLSDAIEGLYEMIETSPRRYA